MSTNDEIASEDYTNDEINGDRDRVFTKESIALDATYSLQNLLVLRHLELTQGISTIDGLVGANPSFPPPVTIEDSPEFKAIEAVQAEQLDSKPATKKIITVFTEPYTKDKVQALIKQLEDDTFNTRIAARDTLAKMGPAVLPDLEKAVKESDDREVRLRAGEAIEYIKTNALREDTAKYLMQASQSIERTEGVLKMAGISISSEKKIVVDEAGNTRIIGPQQLQGNPPAKLTAEDRKGFEEMIRQGDALSSERLNEIRRHVQEHGDWDDYVKLTVLGWSKDARLFYAKALSASNDPKDKQKGIELLIEYLDKNKHFKPDLYFMALAVELRADKDETFMKAFKRAGGDVGKLLDRVDQVVNKDLYHASGLTGSRDPNQHKRGTELLMKYLQENKNYKPDELFTRVAAELGAHNNEAFLKAFKGAGGDITELKGWVNKLVSARQTEAQKRSASADPVHRLWGIGILTELLQKYPKDFKQDKSFMTLAVRLGAHNDKSFMKAFRDTGNNVDELKKAADELKKKDNQ